MNHEQVIDDVAKLQSKYTSQPYSGLHEVRKSAAVSRHLIDSVKINE